MTRHWLALLLAPLVLILDQPCGATTTASLSGRISIDGDLSDWQGDEWVLSDTSNTHFESDGDSRWGVGEEIVRLAVTWDARYLYLAVEFRATEGALLAALGYAPGGLSSLDGAGSFRRAVDFPFDINLMALASTRDVPLVARVDDHHVLSLIDRATAPAAVRAPLAQNAGFEAAIPWESLSLAQPLSLALALTGSEEGTGAGDAAPNPSVELPESVDPSSKTRVRLDRWLSIPADGNDDGVPDFGVSPRAIISVDPDDDLTQPRSDRTDAKIAVSPRVFAPDRAEDASFALRFDDWDDVVEVFVTARVHSIDGSLVRVLYEDAPRAVANSMLTASPIDRWDGRDAQGRIVNGGIYVLSVEWGLVRGERSGRATAGVAVVR